MYLNNCFAKICPSLLVKMISVNCQFKGKKSKGPNMVTKFTK